jgi:predicted anti-sigma-YlaC factor YlaD
MLGHLKTEDFVNLMEGVELPEKFQAHIQSCGQCRATWESMHSVQSEFSSLETDIPEPDWVQFRSSVRDELLSRSIQRQSAVRRWTGWAMRPSVAWALSIVMAVGITTVTVLWNMDHGVKETTPVTTVESSASEPVAEAIDAFPERSLFDDVVSLGEEQQERFRQMLESAEKSPTYKQ